MVERLAGLRWWRWVLAGLAVGMLGALSAALRGDPVLSNYGESIEGKRVFEEALLEQVAGVPRFHDVRVHALTLSPAPGRTQAVHIVTGLYNDGRPENGSVSAVQTWRPAFYVATVPYRPATDIARLTDAAAAARFASLERPTVLDYLDVLHSARGVRYRYAWWRSPNTILLAWLCGGIVGIGVLCPLTLRLLVFGTWHLPADPNPVHAQPSGHTTSDDAPHAPSAAPDPELVLPDRPPDTAAPPPTATPAKRPTRLAAVPLAPTEAATIHAPAFGASRDDFYPTELGTAHQPGKGDRRE